MTEAVSVCSDGIIDLYQPTLSTNIISWVRTRIGIMWHLCLVQNHNDGKPQVMRPRHLCSWWFLRVTPYKNRKQSNCRWSVQRFGATLVHSSSLTWMGEGGSYGTSLRLDHPLGHSASSVALFCLRLITTPFELRPCYGGSCGTDTAEDLFELASHIDSRAVHRGRQSLNLLGDISISDTR